MSTVQPVLKGAHSTTGHPKQPVSEEISDSKVYLVLKPAPSTTGDPKQPVSEQTSDSKVTVDHQNSRRNSKPKEIMSSKDHAALKPKKEKCNKKNKKKSRSSKKSRSGNVFRFDDNKFEANKSDRVGIFGFGNTHIHKQVDSSSEETDSVPSEEEE